MRQTLREGLDGSLGRVVGGITPIANLAQEKSSFDLMLTGGL